MTIKRAISQNYSHGSEKLQNIGCLIIRGYPYCGLRRTRPNHCELFKKAFGEEDIGIILESLPTARFRCHEQLRIKF
jgi:hypothetical protein